MYIFLETSMFVAGIALLLPYILKFKFLIAHFYFNLKCDNNTEDLKPELTDNDGRDETNENEKIKTQTMLYHIDKLYHRIVYYPENKRILCHLFGKDITSIILQYLPTLTLYQVK